MMRVTIWLAGQGLLFGAMSAGWAQDDTNRDQASPQVPSISSIGTGVADRSRALATRNEEKWMAMIVQAHPVHAGIRGQEGTVSVTVSVSADGRPKDCRITKSSGHDLLDTAACAGMMRYARFDPALDAQGRPITAGFSTQVKFAIDQEK